MSSNLILLVLECQSSAVLLNNYSFMSQKQYLASNIVWLEIPASIKSQQISRMTSLSHLKGFLVCLYSLLWQNLLDSILFFVLQCIYLRRSLIKIHSHQCPRHPIPLFNLLFLFQGEGYYGGHCSLTHRFLYVTLCPTNTVTNNAEIFKRRTRYGSSYGSKLHHIPQHLFMFLPCSSLSLLESCFKQVPGLTLLVNLLFTYTTTFNSRSTLGRFSRIFEIIVTS